MRHVLYVDKKITDTEFEAWKKEDIAFWKQYCDISPFYWVIKTDFTDYPVEPDFDGDARVSKAYMKSLTDSVYTKYGKDGTDFIMLLIHEDNWQSSGRLFEVFKARNNITKAKGIWGYNLSNIYYNYHVQVCGWNMGKNDAINTFATLYHERHHALDALIATELGVDVRPLIKVKAWDAGCTHGNEAPWKYIRERENTDSLVAIAPLLRQALTKRQARHDEYIKGTKLTAIKLMEQLVYIYRQMLNKKNGVNNQ